MISSVNGVPTMRSFDKWPLFDLYGHVLPGLECDESALLTDALHHSELMAAHFPLPPTE